MSIPTVREVRSSALTMVVLQPLSWRCTECAVHPERNVHKEQHHIYVA